MQVQTGKEQDFRTWQAKNSDPYGSGVVRYAERWADLMEARLGAPEAGESEEAGLAREVTILLGGVAEKTSREADTEGITGFMYGCAVAALAEFWAHGEALRRWHNLSTQIGDEGERANRDGGVLNPALLRMG